MTNSRRGILRHYCIDISEFLFFNDFYLFINMAVSKIWASNTYCYEEVCNNFKQIHNIGFMNTNLYNACAKRTIQSCVSSVTKSVWLITVLFYGNKVFYLIWLFLRFSVIKLKDVTLTKTNCEVKFMQLFIQKWVW